jgi:pimeloyl-ACP methyl ester carboxylesterase
MNPMESLSMGFALARSLSSYALWTLRTRPRDTSGCVEVGDINMFYRRYGAGEPVLLLHGGFMFAEAWAGQIPELSRHYRVIAPDSRGHGRTTLGTRELTYRRMAEDQAALLEALGCGPAHVVGSSDGGTTALALAMQRPDMVRSLVLLGTPFNTANYSPAAWRAIDKFMRPVSLELISMRVVRRLLSPEPGQGGEFVRRMGKMWYELPDFTAEQLGLIEAPALVIAGDRDEFLSLWDDPLKVFRETAAAIRHARLEVVRGGTHAVHEQRAREVNRLILDFLGG